MSERYPGGHNPSLDMGFVVVEPTTYDDDFVCTCVVCRKVFRSHPIPSDGSPYSARWEGVEPMWDHWKTHQHPC